MSSSLPVEPRATRRAVVGGCTGALALCLAGCARYGDQGGGPAPPATRAGQPGSAAPAAISVAAAEVPVGGGVVLADRGVVVTQPTAGTFAAFDVTCPHQGCAVSEVADGLITCPCHGSEFRIADASVETGPATTGLSPRRAVARGGRVLVT